MRTDPGPSSSSLPVALHKAIVRNAEHRALLTVALLQCLAEEARRRGEDLNLSRLPAAWLYELGALMQLYCWEAAGYRPWLPTDLPTFAEAANDLLRRATIGVSEFQSLGQAWIARRVVDVNSSLFCWECPEVLGSDILILHANEDALVDAIADIVWTNRHSFGAVGKQEHI